MTEVKTKGKIKSGLGHVVKTSTNSNLQVPCPDTFRGQFRDCDYPGEDLGAKYAAEVDNIIRDIKKKGKDVCCFIAESMQSCGGQIIYPEGYLRRVYE